MPDKGEKQGATWPMPKFRFEVDFGTDLGKGSFTEVSGLEMENQIIEYREGDSSLFAPIKMPGLGKVGNVTMKRGVFINDNKFRDWHNEIKMNTIKRRTVIIRLLNENGKVTMEWTLANAWPTKITSTNLESDGNEVAVETLEIVHESIIISNGG